MLPSHHWDIEQLTYHEDEPLIEIDEDNDEGSDPEDKFNKVNELKPGLKSRFRKRPQGHYSIS